ncbi:hypothetical protein KQX54_014258 [Cotesia glomerata]|uniref:Uncharacterized protein n=1 Tax=Cotesia glomerata TaxID=32391 RepID=A0AAV7IT64_COTGL|nr:hypothetical protein KQX54_014258 [Cotesia glomerata]
MNTILDFNGYFSGKKFTIKEYSLYVIRDQTHDVVSHHFQLSKPPKNWHALSSENQNNYKTYFETFGITWKRGTHNEKLIANNLWDILKNVKAIYVINKEKRQLLESYFDKDLPFKFIYLNELGFDFEPKMSTLCRHHKKPEKNNCAEDNASAMMKWLNRVRINPAEIPGQANIVIDFNGYFFSDTEYIIKEYSLIIFSDKTNEVVAKDFQVSKPPIPCHQLDKITQHNYTSYYNSYGIGWNNGTQDNELIKNDLTQKLKNSRKIYVRDQTQNELLISYLDQNFNAVCLADVGLNLEPQMITDCENHVQPDKNICAHDNASRMFKWIKMKGIDNIHSPENDINIVLDFNGYFLAEDKYVIKEYSLYAVREKNNEIIYRDYVISKPPYLCHKLDEVAKLNYAAYYETFGIDWSKGTRDIRFIRSDLQKKLRTSKNIYLRDQEQRELLNSYFNHDFKAINLTDLGLTFNSVEGTNCTNHEHPDKNICANDNATKMVELLAQMPRLPNSRAKENVVIDFNGFFVNDKYVVKEYSSYIIDEETYQVIYNEVGVLGSPIIQKDKSDEKSYKSYNKFLNDIGIDPNKGAPDFELSKESLQSHLNVTNKVFVMDRSKHQYLLNYFDNNLTTGFVYLADLGFKFEPIKNTACSNHKNPSTKNCADDNAQIMLDWLSERKFGVSLGLNQLNLTEPLQRHVIVDFSGYDLPNNEYAIKELNAILVDKNSELDKDLYMIVKPPFPDIQKLPTIFVDAYLEFEKRHGIGWNTGEDDFTKVSQALNDYFETATHVYVKNLEKQKLLEKFIGTKHHFIRFEDLKFRYEPRKHTDDCEHHYNKTSICAVVFSKFMLQWFEHHILRCLPPRHDFDEIDHGFDISQAPGTSYEKTQSVENVYSNVNRGKQSIKNSSNTIEEIQDYSQNSENAYSTIDDEDEDLEPIYSTIDEVQQNVKDLYSNVNKRKSLEHTYSTIDEVQQNVEDLYSKVNKRKSLKPTYSTIDEVQQNVNDSSRPVKKVTFADDLVIGSAASSIPPLPPMPEDFSTINVVPIPSPMPEASDAENSVASPPAMPKSNSLAKRKVSDPNKNTKSFLEDLNNTLKRMRPTEKFNKDLEHCNLRVFENNFLFSSSTLDIIEYYMQ